MATKPSNKSIAVVFWGHKAYCTGNMVTALIQCRNVSSESSVSVQAYGHAVVDTKWTRTAPGNELLLSTTAYPVNSAIRLPKPVYRSDEAVCVYTTPSETLPLQAVLSEGVFVQFELPHDCLPSFRGLGCSVIYFLTLTFHLKPNAEAFRGDASATSASASASSQDPTEVTVRHIHFPFMVYGRGSRETPHLLKYSALSVFPMTSVPLESLLSQPNIEDDFYENRRKISALSHIDAAVYAIRDLEFVCTVCVGLSTATYCAGDMITLCLDFEKCRQTCFAVRAKLVQCEKRSDGSRLQEKVLDSVLRNTGNAVSVYLLLHIPDIVESSFTCPFAEVVYRVDVDFFLDNKVLPTAAETASKPMRPASSAAAMGGEPLAWSMGIEVIPLCYQSINPLVEVIQCLEAGAIRLVKTTEAY